ncbi:MAG: DUF4157 domain-containing protein [Acidimicrobiia bacterium]|nr:DUF4157 domain-containing protein [Acidimicrobiia bacterium]
MLVRVPFLAPGALGMTSGRIILLRRDEPVDGTSVLIAHELVHVRQFAEVGRLRFGARYVWQYLANLVRFRNHREAYRNIAAEVEAYGAAERWAVEARRRAARSAQRSP